VMSGWGARRTPASTSGNGAWPQVSVGAW